MPNIRIKDIPTTASATVNGDFFAVDSNASTRKLDAFNPTIGGILTVNGTGTSVFAGNANTALHVGAAAPYQRAAIGATRRLNYGDVLFSRNLQGQAGTDAYTTIGTDTGSGYAGFEARYGGAARILVGDGATTANAVVTPTVALSATTSSVLVPLATPFSISNSITVASGTLGVGAVGTGGSFFVNTPSASENYGSGLAVDGSYPGGVGAQSVVNLKAFGVMSGGGYGSTLTFQTTLNGVFSEVMRINSGRNLLIGTTTDSSNGRLQLATHTASSGGIGFGTDTSLYRAAAGALMLTDGTVTGLFWARTANSALEIGPQSNHSLILRTNNTVALTLDTSQNATFSKDVVLGFNGPSVPSTLSGRAPRQGLVFDGTTNATMTLGSAIGTGDFTVVVWVNPNSTSGVQLLIGDSSGNGSMSLNGASLRWFDLTGGSKTFTSTVTAGKMSMVTIVRSGTTLTSYANAIAGDTHTSAHNLSGTSWVIGGYGGGDRTTGIVGGPTIYNRALTQDELRKLYENGAPAAADLGIAGSVPPSNTALSGETFTNFQYDTFTGASTTGFTATETGGQGCQGTTGRVSSGTFLGLAPAGTRYRVTFTATLTSGVPPVVAIGKVNVGTISASSIVTNGANTHILTTTAALTAEFGPNSGNVFFASVGNTSYSISGFSVTRLGAVLAPDATQTGGGLTWYDTSGNGANITLPANGVSWNVPFSGNITGGSTLVLRTNNTTALSLDSNQNANLAGSYLFLGGAGSNFYIRSTGSNNGLIRGNVLSADFASAFVLRNDTGTAEYLRIENPSGALLLGTATNSSNGRLQLATHTAATGGIGFGSDVTLYRSAADTLRTDDTFQAAGGIASGSYLGAPDCYLNNAAGTTRAIYWQTAGVSRWALYTNSSTESGSNAGSNLTLSRYSDAGAYINDPLTISRATGNVVLAGALNVNGDTTLGDYVGDADVIIAAQSTGVGYLRWRPTVSGTNAYGFTIGYDNANGKLSFLRHEFSTAGVEWMSVSRSTGNVTFSGTIVDPAITGTILEDIFTITDAAAFEVDPGNGSIQLITLGASRTPKATNFAAGESVTMMIDDGTAFTLTWTDATWGTGGVKWVGGSAPTLATTGYTVIQLWKVGTQVYGARVGDVV